MQGMTKNIPGPWEKSEVSGEDWGLEVYCTPYLCPALLQSAKSEDDRSLVFLNNLTTAELFCIYRKTGNLSLATPERTTLTTSWCYANQNRKCLLSMLILVVWPRLDFLCFWIGSSLSIENSGQHNDLYCG